MAVPQESSSAATASARPRGALEGLRVLDASRVLGGPLCGQILGDHGAEVIKIESPQGDDTRTWGPPFSSTDGISAYYAGLNRNKTVAVIDLEDSAGRDQLLGLLEGADVLIENFKQSTANRWGLTDLKLRSRFPRLVHCRVSGFGPDGPFGGLPAYDTAVQGMTGLMSVNGDPATQSMRVGLPVVDMTTALNAVIGVLLALQERQKSGLGQLVETTLYDCGLSLLHPHAANYLMSGKCPTATGNAHPNIYPYDSFKTAGGAIYLAVGNDTQFKKCCEMLECLHLASDPRYATNARRSSNRDTLRPILAKALGHKDGRTLAQELTSAGVPCAPILTVQEALQHAHTVHRNMVIQIGENYQGLGSPIALQRTPASYRLAPQALPSAGTPVNLGWKLAIEMMAK